MAKRLIFIDFIRGMMIFYMVILHAFLYRVVHQYKPLFEEIMTTAHIMARIVAAPFIFFGLWGSFFCMLGGIVFIYQVRADYESKENFKAGPYFLQRGLSGLILIVIQYIWLTLFAPKSIEHPGPTTYSLITGAIERFEFTPLRAIHYSTTGMIESLGWIIVVLSILGYFVYRKKRNQYLKFYGIFGIAVILTIAISILLEIWISDPTQFFDDLYDNGKILQVIFLLKLTSNRFSFFPLIVFGLCGGFMGYNLIHQRNEKRMLITLFSVGGVCIIGYIIIIIMGFDMMSGYTSSYVPLPLHLLNLGGQCIYIASFYLMFRKYQRKSSERERDIGIVRFLNMYSSNSLTVYIFEPLTSILTFQLVQNLYFQAISEEFFVWMGFLLLNGLLWWTILYFWRKKEYKFSVEWNLGKLKKVLKKSPKSSQ